MRGIIALLTMTLVACGIAVVGVAPEGAVEAMEAGPADALEAGPSDEASDGATLQPSLVDSSIVDAPEELVDAGGDAQLDSGSLPVATFTPENSVTINDSTTTVCSGSGGNASLKLTNSGSATYLVRWINNGCTEKDFGEVTPGSIVIWGSYKTHRWRLRRKSDNAIIVDFTLKANTTVDVK